MGKSDYESDIETLRVMTGIYCRAHHGGKDICDKCKSVYEYSIERTRRCPNQHKGNCKSCSIHCYQPEMRQGIREIMAYAAPRMTFRHPVLTFRYLKKKLRERKA